MDNRFIPYVGTSKYIFLSYSRGDVKQMLAVSHGLYEKSYRLWYDEGIPPGDDWAANIAEHMEHAGAVIFFLSAKSLVSPNCFSEVKTAKDTGKSIICVLCDDSAGILHSALTEGRPLTDRETETVRELCRPFFERRKDKSKIPSPGSWLPVMNGAAFVNGQGEDHAQQEKDILATGLLDKSFIGPYQTGSGGGGGKNRWLIAILLSVLVFAGALAGVWAIRSGRYTPPGTGAAGEEVAASPATAPTPLPTVDPSVFNGFFGTVKFQGDTLPNAVNIITGLPTDNFQKEDLQLIKQLHVCGNLPLINGQGISYDNGRWKLNGASVVPGDIRDLSLIGQMYYLTELTLVYQNITDFSDLEELPVLTSLNLSGNPLTRIPELEGFSSLQEINLSHTEVKDLSGLDGLKSLKRVYVSADMLPLEPDKDAEYEIILVY